MKQIVISALLFVATWILLFLLSNCSALAHSERGFTHVVETTGPCIKMFNKCDYETQLWGIDWNSDGVIDECKELILIHGKLHERVSAPSGHNECTCKPHPTE
jgi:hypothetical protein